MKWKSLAILGIILITLIPLYASNKYIQRRCRPRESLGGLFLYLIVMMAMVFLYTFGIVLLIKNLFPPA